MQKYLTSTSFNNFNLQAAKPSDTATSTAGIAFGGFTYATKQLVTNANLNNALPGLSASDSFTIGIKKGGATTNVAIDLSQVPGTLNLANIVSYINDQLSAAGFSTRFQKTQTGGTATSDTNATYGLQITPGGVEQVSLSAASTPSLYMVGNSGLATETKTTTNSATSAVTTTPADQAGRLTKLSGIDGTPTATFSVNQQATTGTTTAAGHGGGRQRQCLCHRHRHRQFRQPAQPGHARTSISPNMIPPAMSCSRICWAAAAAPTAMAWRWIRPAAWWSPARPPPT